MPTYSKPDSTPGEMSQAKRRLAKKHATDALQKLDPRFGLTVEEKQTVLAMLIEGKAIKEICHTLDKEVGDLREFLRSAEAHRAIEQAVSGFSARLPMMALALFEKVLEDEEQQFSIALKVNIAMKVWDRLSDRLLPGTDAGQKRNLDDMTLEDLQLMQSQLQENITNLTNLRAENAKEIYDADDEA